MTDYNDLIQRLEAFGAVFNRENVALDAADAINELVADLAAARAAIQWAFGMRDDLAPEANAAIAAARAEGDE